MFDSFQAWFLLFRKFTECPVLLCCFVYQYFQRTFILVALKDFCIAILFFSRCASSFSSISLKSLIAFVLAGAKVIAFLFFPNYFKIFLIFFFVRLKAFVLLLTKAGAKILLVFILPNLFAFILSRFPAYIMASLLVFITRLVLNLRSFPSFSFYPYLFKDRFLFLRLQRYFLFLSFQIFSLLFLPFFRLKL